MKRKTKSSPSILLIDNYDSFTFNLYQYLCELGTSCLVVRNDEIDIEGIQKLSPDGILISPGPGNPDSAGISLEVIRRFSGKIPILGVCLGHQAIGQAFGGKVVRAKTLMHGKESDIYHNRKSLYRGIANPFSATRYHSLLVEKKSLPKCLEITAQTQDGLVMGLRHKKYKVFGVQYHPESYKTTAGKVLLQNFLNELSR